MATITPPEETRAEFRTLADIIDRIGVPAYRILLHPVPGKATLEDLIAFEARENRLAELVDGVLVEKAMGFLQSSLACVMIQLIRNYMDQNPLGIVAGPDGMMRFAPKLVRMPDVSVVFWGQFLGRRLTDQPAPAIFPDLAVEIMSKGNTKKEMDRKLREYFAVGTRLAWYLYPKTRTARVYTALDRMTALDESGTLDGGDVLPGFRLAIREWFDRAERPFGGA